MRRSQNREKHRTPPPPSLFVYSSLLVENPTRRLVARCSSGVPSKVCDQAHLPRPDLVARHSRRATRPIAKTTRRAPCPCCIGFRYCLMSWWWWWRYRVVVVSLWCCRVVNTRLSGLRESRRQVASGVCRTLLCRTLLVMSSSAVLFLGRSAAQVEPFFVHYVWYHTQEIECKKTNNNNNRGGRFHGTQRGLSWLSFLYSMRLFLRYGAFGVLCGE